MFIHVQRKVFIGNEIMSWMLITYFDIINLIFFPIGDSYDNIARLAKYLITSLSERVALR